MENKFPEWFVYAFYAFAFLAVLFIIYTYYRVFKIITGKCSNCLKRPKLSKGRWLWEIWKIGVMPLKKVSVFCKGCKKKIEYREGKFVEI